MLSFASKTALALLLCAAACSDSTPSSGITRPPVTPPQFDPPPVVFDWVGSYMGWMRGEDHGVSFDDVPVRFTLSGSGGDVCPPARFETVNAHLRITAGPVVFELCDVSITSSSDARHEQTEGDRRHVLTLGRFSGGGGTANVILGDVTIQEPDGNGAFATVHHAVFTVQRF